METVVLGVIVALIGVLGIYLQVKQKDNEKRFELNEKHAERKATEQEKITGAWKAVFEKETELTKKESEFISKRLDLTEQALKDSQNREQSCEHRLTRLETILQMNGLLTPETLQQNDNHTQL